jgi:apolipoprotein N-acyltransferase
MKLLRPTRHRALLVLSGVLLGIGFPPLPLGLCAWIGFMPLLLVLEELEESVQEVTRKQIWWLVGRLYLVFFVFHGASNWWVSSWQREADPYLMAAGIALWIAHPFFFAAPMLVYVSLRRRAGRSVALVALPFLWTAFEWAHSLGELSYPWQALGYTQLAYTPLVQIADITGVWGVSFVVVVINACCMQVYWLWQEQEQTDKRKSQAQNSLSLMLRCAQMFAWVLLRARVLVVGIAGLLLALLWYGLVRLQTFRHDQLLASHPSVTVGVIQPNINPWAKWQGNAVSQVAFHQALQDSLRLALQANTALPVAHRRLRLALWSEVAIPYRILSPVNDAYLQALQAWVDSTGVALITGIPSDTVYAGRLSAPTSAVAAPRGSDTVYFDSFNTTALFIPGTPLSPHLPSGAGAAHGSSTYYPPVQMYRKMKLTPFAERVPYADAFSFAVKILTWNVGISGWQLGPQQHCLAFTFADSGGTAKSPVQARVGTIICIESVYPDFVAGFTRTGANLLTVVTNDGWFNHTPGPYQHYAIAAMRAIENRRYLARCANTGISGYITPTGRSLQESSNDTRTALAETLPLLEGQTLYVCWGDWLPMACFLLSVGIVVWTRLSKPNAESRIG